MLELIHTFSSIKALSQHKNDPKLFFDAWINYVSTIEPSLLKRVQKDIIPYSFEETLWPVIQKALSQLDRIHRIEASIKRHVKSISPQFLSLFTLDTPISVVSWLGLCQGAGWVYKENDRIMVMLGVEKIIELNWDSEWHLKALLAHELVHAGHMLTRNDDLERDFSSVSEQSIWQLYIEGVAQFTQIYLAGIPFHQDKDYWYERCKENHHLICDTFLSRLEEEKPTTDFFGDWQCFLGLPDVGYYLGAMFIRSIKHLELKHIMVLPFPEIKDLLLSYLAQA